MIAVELTRQNAPTLFPVLFQRICAFCTDLRTDSDWAYLSQKLLEALDAPRPAIRAFAAIDGSNVVGHCVVTLEEWSGKILLNVWQYSIDRGAKVPPEEIARCWASIQRWAQERGATEVQIAAATESRARLFSKRYGFTFHRSLMRRPLSSAGTTEPQGASVLALKIAQGA